MAKGPLPEGWRIVGLYHHGEGRPEPTTTRDVSDNDVASANAIIVSYTSRRTGTTIHRTIHGAESKAGIGDVIVTTTRVVSPVGSSARD